MITCNTTSQTIAMAVAEILEEPLVSLQPDGSINGESDTDLDDDRIIVIASTPSNRSHMELLELQERARKRDPEEVVTVIPYMGYARQDEAFNTGEPVSARAVARAVGASTDRVYSVNPHNISVLDYFGVPAEPIDASPQLWNALPDDLIDPVFLGPDEDASWLARSVRDTYGSGQVENFDKLRLSSTDVEMSAGDKDFSGRDVVLVDDMISTGGTMSEAIRILNEQDTKRIFVTCIHPVLVDEALVKLYRAGIKSIYATNTLDRSVSMVSAAPPIAEKL